MRFARYSFGECYYSNRVVKQDRTKKIVELQIAQNKKYKIILLMEDQIKAVNDNFEEPRKKMQQRKANNEIK